MIKKIIVLLLLTLTFTMYASSGWRQASEANHNVLNDVFFLNENLGWVVGASGTILRTTDGGNTWIEATDMEALSKSLYSIYFVNENIGYAGGVKDLLIKTTDGGATWTEVTFNSIGGSIYSIYFADENNGWVLSGVSKGGTISHTTDGGVNWVTQVTETSVDLKVMDFSSPGHGICVGSYKGAFALYYTSDGLSWGKAPAPTLPAVYNGRTDIRGLAMVNDTVACFSGWGTSSSGLQPSLTVRTTDGGETWVYQMQAEENRIYNTMYGMDFKDELNGITVGFSPYKGSIAYITNDGGITWKEIDFPMGFRAKSVSIKNNKVCVIGGGGNAIATSDDFGETWKLQTKIVSENLWGGLEIISDSIIFASGFYGAVLKSIDNGETWNSTYVSDKNVCPTVRELFFLDENRGFTAQKNRVVSKTIDGGTTWTQIMADTSISGYTNYGVQFLDENIGFVVGENGDQGAFYKTTDGGNNWSLTKGAFGEVLKSVHFSNSANGVVVGKNIVAYTENGGSSWTNSTITGSATNGEFNKVRFLNNNFGLACGSILIKTSDAGKLWEYVIVPDLTKEIKSCAIVDEQTWYIAGDKYLLKTTDGGATWSNAVDLGVVKERQTYDVEVDSEGYPWLATGSSKIYTASPEVSVKYIDGNLPNKFSLEANYPNPFNPTTIIRYSISVADAFHASPTNVTLKVYDMLGQEVATLVNETQKSGTYEVVFNATQLSSGIYIYTLHNAGLLQSRKMLLIK